MGRTPGEHGYYPGQGIEGAVHNLVIEPRQGVRQCQRWTDNEGVSSSIQPEPSQRPPGIGRKEYEMQQSHDRSDNGRVSQCGDGYLTAYTPRSGQEATYRRM